MSCVEDALYLNYLCKQCHYACVETVNHFRLHPSSITDIYKVLRTSCGFRLLSATTAAGEDDFNGMLNFGTLRLYAAGGVAGMSNIGMAKTSNGGTSTLGAQCEHVRYVKFWHQEQRDVDLRQSAQLFRPCHFGEFDI